ncbi:MAG: hypothetical protein WB762_29555 [Candidatus Sulfotelmatobacter sp.]
MADHYLHLLADFAFVLARYSQDLPLRLHLFYFLLESDKQTMEGPQVSS